MFELLGIPPQALFGQLLLGLINGAFYAVLSLGLAVIFGLLNIVNFAHGALYMLGAFVAWLLLTFLGRASGGALPRRPISAGPSLGAPDGPSTPRLTPPNSAPTGGGRH